MSKQAADHHKKEAYIQPALVKHELLRDITAASSNGCAHGKGIGLDKQCSQESWGLAGS